jgi:hypothetical protein
LLLSILMVTNMIGAMLLLPALTVLVRPAFIVGAAGKVKGRQETVTTVPVREVGGTR